MLAYVFICIQHYAGRVMEKITGSKITSSNVVVITSPYLLPLLLLFLLHVFVLARCTSDHPLCENALWDRIKTGYIKNKRTANNTDNDHGARGRGLKYIKMDCESI